ncbi:MAG: VanZ family protein [Lachnospiraceae bacterium]|nr:VanZ family protein [Lachnospiraceae bacterium]MDE6252950.1 VanZ family protein [Lachnospiraceae bacterium]
MLIIQEILGYFLIGFIGMAGLAIIWLPAWVIFKKKMSFKRFTSYFIFAYIILLIFGVTVLGSLAIKITAGHGVIADIHSLNIIPFNFLRETWAMGERNKITQVIANILMFVPLGFITPVAFPKTRRLWKTAVYMAAFSFLIEFIQYFIGRSADIDDLMLNTLGGILGYIIFYILKNFFKGTNVKERGV